MMLAVGHVISNSDTPRASAYGGGGWSCAGSAYDGGGRSCDPTRPHLEDIWGASGGHLAARHLGDPWETRWGVEGNGSYYYYVSSAKVA